MSSTSNSNPRRIHRKRISALRLSSDTTSTLPEYIPAGWNHHPQQQPSDSRLEAQDELLDKPPDYPDSAEEADEDTDDTDTNIVYVPHLPPAVTLSPRPHTAPPRRAKRFLPTHKRGQSTQSQSKLLQQPEPSDPFLDSLLERSVHALEMSNTLLQSSISTQTSLSAILKSDSPGDRTLEAHVVNMSSRIRGTWDTRAAWADDLEEISRNVEGLFGEESDSGVGVGLGLRRQTSPSQESSISCSLPSSSSPPMRRNRRRPSLDLRQASDPFIPRLHYSQQNRANLISPPPRALTQYVASTQDAESILLPSTIGLRSPPSVHPTPDWKPLSEFASSSTTSLLSSLSTPSLPPKHMDKPLEPSTRAYNMLSSFVYRPAPSSGSATPSTSFTTSFISNMRRDSRNASTSTERSNGNSNARRRSSPSPVSHKSPDRLYRQDSCSSCGSQQQTSNRGVSPLPFVISHRPMTPPVEESSNSSSSSDGCVAKRTVQCLRKILDDQPQPQPQVNEASKRLRAPAFMPRTPAPVAQAGTSTATASVSRLFTKGTHSSSTRAPSPPRQSAMKHSRTPSLNNSLNTTPSNATPPPLPSPVPSSLSIPDMLSKVLGGGSASSSGQSTPSKRISFAELPESYASTRPGGVGSSKFKDKHNRRKRKSGSSSRGGAESSASGAGKADGSVGGEGSGGGWWNGWLTATSSSSSHGLSLSLARQEERMEDRLTRNWGGRMGAGFGNGLDEWAV